MKKLLLTLTFLLLTGLSTNQVQAITDPPLFSCLQPVGTATASYGTGIHGIPGDSRTFSGSDVVYSIDQDHVLQCFCTADGKSGIQSNWWKIDTLSAEDQDFFMRRGWVYVPTGERWGLASSPYLVKNDSFSCEGGRGGGSSDNGGTGGGSSSSSSNSSSDTAGRGGSILGASTLATTGTAQKILTFYLIGTVAALLAYRLGRG